MLLQALNQYADSGEEGSTPPGYAVKSLGFELRIHPDLQGADLVSLYESAETKGGKPRREAEQSLVPNISRANNPPPMLGCDNAAFVLGRPKASPDMTKQAKEDSKAAAKCQAFDDLLGEYAASCGDADAFAFLQWRDAGEPGLAESIERLDAFELKRLDLDLIALRVGRTGHRLHESAAAQEFWSHRSMASKGSGRQLICLCCGRYKPVVDTVPQSLIGALVPATSTSNIALMSTNFSSASRGASGTGLKSAPICADCASGAVSAFNKLAASEKHRWGGRSEETATIWWTKDGSVDLGCLDDPEPDAIANLLNSPGKGRPPGQLDDDEVDRFYALTFSGNVARLVVRHWIDLPLDDVRGNVTAWFNDSATPAPDKPHHSVSALATSCGELLRKDGAWVETPPSGSRGVLLQCALMDQPPPTNLLVRAVSRAKAEVNYLGSSDGRTAAIARKRMHARFGLIRLILNRTSAKENKVPQFLDEENISPAYVSGRLFAVRESLQYAASGGVNASITDRFFARASANPESVEGTLSRLEKQHIRTLERKGKRGSSIRLSARIDELHARQGPAPGRLPVADQALWIAGYYQQRVANFAHSAEAKLAKQIGSASSAVDMSEED